MQASATALDIGKSLDTTLSPLRIAPHRRSDIKDLYFGPKDGRMRGAMSSTKVMP